MEDFPHGYRCRRDITYGTRPTGDLHLDLYLPPMKTGGWGDAEAGAGTGAGVPVVVFIHGGSWRSHHRSEFDPGWLPCEADVAIAAISYRFSQVVPFPAQLHDCKAAVRWLRAHGAEWHLDAGRIGVIGESAGGHLALLLGLTAGHAELEGAAMEGERLEGERLKSERLEAEKSQPHVAQSSAVDAVVAFYPPTDLPAAGDYYERRPGKKPDAPGCEPAAMLLHGPVTEKPALARLASPVYHAHRDAPPCLLFHGTDDRLVPFDQSVRMEAALRQAGAAVELVAVEGADHNFDDPAHMARAWAFLRQHLLADGG